MRSRDLAVTAVAVVVFLALAASMSRVWNGTVGISDTPVYERYGERMADGDIPYRDFRLEYPPGALPAFAVPALVGEGPRGYARAFSVTMVAWGVAAIILMTAVLQGLGASTGRRAAALAVMAFSPLLLGGLLFTRFDLYPAALTVGALAALVVGRDRLGAGVLGAAIAVKLYPAVWLPLLYVWVRRRKGSREAAVAVVITAAVVVAAFLPFFAIAPDGVVDSVQRQLSRPLQIESLGAGILLALHHAAGMGLDWKSGHGSQNLVGDPAAVAAVLTSLLQIAVLVWLWVRFARGALDGERLVRYAAAALAAFVALGKVLSPQFLVWLLPVVPLVGGVAGAAASALLVVACLLTRAWFPERYWELVKEFDPTASWLVFTRNLLLVGIVVILLTATERGPARSRSPAPSPDHS